LYGSALNGIVVIDEALPHLPFVPYSEVNEIFVQAQELALSFAIDAQENDIVGTLTQVCSYQVTSIRH